MQQQSRHLEQSAAEPIYRELRNLILQGKMSGGMPLKQDEIAREHGVSKIPVREALQKLEADGLVVFIRNRGAFVHQLSSDEVLHLLDIRVALECRALELSIPNMIATDLSAMRKLLAEYSRKTELLQWSAMNLQFHNMLYEPCGNPNLLSMISDLQDRIGPFLRLVVTEATGLERPMREHDEILDACVKSQVDLAAKLLKAHIETTKREVAAYMRRSS